MSLGFCCLGHRCNPSGPDTVLLTQTQSFCPNPLENTPCNLAHGELAGLFWACMQSHSTSKSSISLYLWVKLASLSSQQFTQHCWQTDWSPEAKVQQSGHYRAVKLCCVSCMLTAEDFMVWWGGRVEHPRDKHLTFNCLPSSPVTRSVELCCLQLGKLAMTQSQWCVRFVVLGLRLNSLLSRVYLCLLWVPVHFSAAVVYRTAAPNRSTTTRRQRDEEDVRLAWMKQQKRRYRWSQNEELQTSKLCLMVLMLMGLPGPGSETGCSGAPVSGRSSDRCGSITCLFVHLFLRLMIETWRTKKCMWRRYTAQITFLGQRSNTAFLLFIWERIKSCTFTGDAGMFPEDYSNISHTPTGKCAASHQTRVPSLWQHIAVSRSRSSSKDFLLHSSSHSGVPSVHPRRQITNPDTFL